MSKRRIVVLIGAVMLLLIPTSMLWYKFQFSMTPAKAFIVGQPTAQQRVLVATQGSPFKDALVAGVVEHLKLKTVYANVVDVTALPNMKESDWTAIVVIHTWEMGKPPPDVQVFIERAPDKHKLIVVSTSGNGKGKIDTPGIDALSGASVLSEVPQRVANVITRLDAILDMTTTTTPH